MDLVFSDIHADSNALDLILKIAQSKVFISEYGDFDRILNLGDLLERGTSPANVLKKMTELSHSYNLESVMGNHDEAYLYNRRVSGSSLESLDAHLRLKESDLDFFSKNKDETFGSQQFTDKKKKLVCVHGGPLDPKNIIPKDSGKESWLYQKTWQRLSEEDFEFFSYSGYHFKAENAFKEVEKKMHNFVVLSGHQHQEACIKQNEKGIISNEYTNLEKKIARIDNHKLESKEIPIETKSNFLIRVGLGGPEGYYGVGSANPQFGIIQDNPRKVVLFTIHQ